MRGRDEKAKLGNGPERITGTKSQKLKSCHFFQSATPLRRLSTSGRARPKPSVTRESCSCHSSTYKGLRSGIYKNTNVQGQKLEV